ncbi:BLUF domain-containing protein [Roseateles terrae]|uniref:BLUF domain-containing protein n=1 Tax=Roseateles terrae TaxID=431060 RepID=A0ABR6GQ79_9BURK|nr:BLUF domain-containing protein [Roseateles terrae]MBB3193827.1 hypothetical protein [Roseateles terrae]OWQ89032.1 hypothetical protein CDN98_00265 [Roseateles terrae]
MASSIRQVLYLSRVAQDVDDQSLKRIVAAAQMNNRRRDVTGVLAVGDGIFAQILEGDSNDVEQTLIRIRADERHHDVQMVLDSHTSARSFDRWSMELLMDEVSAKLAEGVFCGERFPDELVQHLKTQHSQDPVCWSGDLRAMALSS